MKVLVALLFVVFSTTHALRCWECQPSISNEACLQNGYVKECAHNQDACEDQVRHMFGGRMMMVEKRCKQKQACVTNYDQNLRPANPIQCHASSHNSICTCCCDRDRCNKDLATCFGTLTPATGQDCPDFPIQPEHGIRQCQGNKEPGTLCEFKCNNGYIMEGRGRITCMTSGQYDYEPPTCVEKTCRPLLEAPGNGSISCTRDNYLRSRCKFTCDENFSLVGPEFVECRENLFNPNAKYGRWSLRNGRRPYCRPLFCPFQSPLYHASFSCTNEDRLGSTCTFTCPPRFEIFPNHIPGQDFSRTHCMSNGQWETPFPCCHLPCPPFAIVDFFLVLDSSSSVQQENWDRMKNFVETMLSNFTVRSDAAQYSAFRYNSDIDTQTQIFLNSTGSREEFIEAFNRIPYNGDGTNTGRALDHLRTNMLCVGNRERAPDIVLLITDGQSTDRVLLPATRLRRAKCFDDDDDDDDDHGLRLLVLPIQHADGGELSEEEIRNIAGRENEENILTDALEGGFEALNEEFARELAGYLCPVPCANPFHSHPDEIPSRLAGYVNDIRKKK